MLKKLQLKNMNTFTAKQTKPTLYSGLIIKVATKAFINSPCFYGHLH
jgi:hypothetical protein